MLINISEGIGINFSPSNEREEIIQNVRTIIATTKETIPIFREFGLSSILDQPINVARAKITAEVADAIKKYEPRAKLVSIDFEGNMMDGELNPIITIQI